MILGENGEKMSKSRGNVINPDDIVLKYGADTLRLYEMFMGPKGELKQHVNDKVNFEVKDGELTVSPVDESKAAGAAHGLYRALVHNMVTGVTQGFSKSLIITGSVYFCDPS